MTVSIFLFNFEKELICLYRRTVYKYHQNLEELEVQTHTLPALFFVEGRAEDVD